MKKLLFFVLLMMVSQPARTQVVDETAAIWDRPSQLAGLYVEYRTGTRTLEDRMLRESLSARHIIKAGEQSLRYDGRIYLWAAPFLYQTSDGMTLAFAITGGGPFLLFGDSDRPYRKSFFGSDPKVALYPAPIAFFILLTALPYLGRRQSARIRKLAAFSLAGVLLLAGGVALELNFYRLIVLEGGIFWPHYVWRTFANLGIVSLLVVPMYVLSIRKHRDYIIPLQMLHISLIGISGFALFLMATFWGIVGEFSPYF